MKSLDLARCAERAFGAATLLCGFFLLCPLLWNLVAVSLGLDSLQAVLCSADRTAQMKVEEEMAQASFLEQRRPKRACR